MFGSIFLAGTQTKSLLSTFNDNAKSISIAPYTKKKGWEKSGMYPYIPLYIVATRHKCTSYFMQ